MGTDKAGRSSIDVIVSGCSRPNLFRYRSTADDVLRGIDLSGKLAIVTGGYSGLGLATTRALAGAGAHVVVPQMEGMGGVYCEDCDIAAPTPVDDPSAGGVRAYATDPEQAARLWRLSAELTGVDAFATTA